MGGILRGGSKGSLMALPRMNLEHLVESVPDAVVGVDETGVIRLVNRLTESLFGYERDDMVGAPVEMLVPGHARPGHPEHRKHFAADGRTRHMGSQPMLSGRRADGSEFPADIALSTMDTGNGMLVIAAVRDLTDHLRGQRDRAKLDRLAAVLEHSADAIVSRTLSGNIASWNPAAERMFGYAGEEIVGKSGRSLIPDDRGDEVNTILAKILTGQTIDRLQTTRLRKDGTVFPVSLTVSPIRDEHGKITGVSTITSDETVQRRFIEVAQRMAAIVENSADAILSSTLNGIVTSWNPASETIYGYSSAEIIGRSLQPLTPPDRAHEVTDILSRIETGQRVEQYETVCVRKDGTEFPISLTVSPIRDADAKVTGASVIARDLTQRTRAADAARSMIEASLDLMVAVGPGGTITDANQPTVNVTGASREELIGTSFSGYFTDWQKAEEIYERVSSEGKAMNHPLTLRHRDGTLTEVLCNASRDPRGGVLGVFVAARDITKQILAQREAAHQQALELDRLVELERAAKLAVESEHEMRALKKEIERLRQSAPAS
jgi:PAS domain S-box-containing protein